MASKHLTNALLLGSIGIALLAACGTPPQELSVGDCLRDPSAGAKGVTVVDCASPHRGQIVGQYEPEGGPYPGVEMLADESEIPCQEAFAEFVGSDPLTSIYDLFPLIPTESAWNDGDRTVACVAATYGDLRVTSSFEDANR